MNGNQYIGITASKGRAFLRSAKVRLQKHFSRARKESWDWKLYVDMFNYIDDLELVYEVSVLDVVRGKEQAHIREMELVKKYKLNDHEKIELIQLVQDMGFPLIKDRSVLPEDGFDPRSTDNLDFLANYQA